MSDSQEKPHKGKSAQKTDTPSPCPGCGKPFSHKRPLCSACIAKLINSESTASVQLMMSSFENMAKQALDSMSASISKMSAAQQPPEVPGIVPPHRVISSQMENCPGPSKNPSTRAERDISNSDASGSDEHEEDSDSPVHKGRFRLSPDHTLDLLKSILATLEIKQDPAPPRSVQDLLYAELDRQKKVAFPIHKSIYEMIQEEWKFPDKRSFIPKTSKRRYPFSEEDVKLWAKCPRIDASVSDISRNSAIPFEDTGYLKDGMDRKADTYLKRSWDSTAAALTPMLAATCTARTASLWVTEFKNMISEDTTKEELLSSIPALASAVDFLSDSATEAIRLSAKSLALTNNARRALWLKNWEGDFTTKSKLCSLPFEGSLLFGKQLQDTLEKLAEKKSKFPRLSNFKQETKRNFRPFKKQIKNQKDVQSHSGKSWQNNRYNRPKGLLLNTQQPTGQKPNNQ